jgi:hypothetical protein
MRYSPIKNYPAVCLSLYSMFGFAWTTADILAQFADPCEEASKASMKCLERAHYNRNEVSHHNTPTGEVGSHYCVVVHGLL